MLIRKKTLMLVAHPNLGSSFSNKKIINSISLLENVNIHLLYETYPNMQMIDIISEQELLIAADLVILQFPLFWFSTPPILKIWQDEVLRPGFAFGSFEKDFKLKGKKLLLSITTAGSREKYHAGNSYHYTLDEILRPLQMTANYCKMIYQGYIQSNRKCSINNLGLDQEINDHLTKLKKVINDIEK